MTLLRNQKKNFNPRKKEINPHITLKNGLAITRILLEVIVTERITIHLRSLFGGAVRFNNNDGG